MEIVARKPERQLFSAKAVEQLGTSNQCNTFINENKTQLLFIDEQDYCIICIDNETILEQGETVDDWEDGSHSIAQEWEPIQLVHFEYKAIKL